MNELELLKKRVSDLEGILNKITRSDRYLFQKNLEYTDGKNIQLGISTGTKFGTGTTQKIGFYNTAPVAQQAHTTTAGGIATLLTNLGLMAP